jgi:hypothetical protein
MMGAAPASSTPMPQAVPKFAVPRHIRETFSPDRPSGTNSTRISSPKAIAE